MCPDANRSAIQATIWMVLKIMRPSYDLKNGHDVILMLHSIWIEDTQMYVTEKGSNRKVQLLMEQDH